MEKILEKSGKSQGILSEEKSGNPEVPPWSDLARRYPGGGVPTSGTPQSDLAGGVPQWGEGGVPHLVQYNRLST